jgi:hypothetical protein
MEDDVTSHAHALCVGLHVVLIIPSEEIHRTIPLNLSHDRTGFSKAPAIAHVQLGCGASKERSQECTAT